MAGIGFEIRKILKKDTIFSLVKAFSYAGIVSSGPWIVSMLSILVAGFLVNYYFNSKHMVVAFTLMITYIIAFSLITTSFFQLSFTRYVADVLFKKEKEKVLPNTIGAIVISMLIGSIFVLPFSISIYHETKNLMLTFLFEATFVIMCAIWIVNIVLTGLKNYKFIFYSFLISYVLIVVLSVIIGDLGLEYFMLSFFIGQSILLYFLMSMFFKEFKTNKLISFEFLKNIYKDLVFIGFFLNASIWIDKFIFWFAPSTSVEGIGLLRFSPIYDYPIFLAYLAIAPAMAIFLLRIEVDFALNYDKYFSAARENGTLKELYIYANEMFDSAKMGLIEILRIQILVTFLIILFADNIFNFFHISKIYIPLFIVDMIGTTLLVFFMAIVTILFYLDRRKEVLVLVVLLFFLNFSLTLFTQYLGPFYYGYGFALAYFIVSIIGLVFLNKNFERFHYETFMFL
ncbi:putative membrane protein [Nautilia profundicola AmH]|uniref:Membrane protein n=1 Tax=Nautilia profundicola (strain ATCC BAA-1463 / DSM 18972 / AmH) TaxID=598659 RepID=B9L633_NAUPA|nr:exopolysaccharide Pel transporter PelG [Nautilia profundicola]ACM93475.1 putative membrane protein [Nautilia profundicola AmH]